MSDKTDNELIAEFLGWKPFDWRQYWITSGGIEHATGDLKFDTSWDWLMPVVEKIENLDGATKYRVEIEDTICKISGRHNSPLKTEIFHARTYRRGKIGTVYQSVVEFIKWYNQSKSELQEPTGWVSIKERLPELANSAQFNAGTYLQSNEIIVATKEGRVFATVYSNLGFANLNSRTDEVILWQPLPKHRVRSHHDK